jgi:hypothetical protein
MDNEQSIPEPSSLNLLLPNDDQQGVWRALGR